MAVLIVEDAESDAQLVVRLLNKAGYEIASTRVETAGQMRAALEKQAWDIVISDYNLPQFDGHTALTILRETDLDIPFIVVSGVMGEETAVDMMKAGAHDYVMKGNLLRLIPAVERELEQTEVRRKRKRADDLLILKAKELLINHEATISSMAILAEFRDPETGAHIQRTKLYVKLMVEKLVDAMPYSSEHIELIWHSAPLHDIGKVAIPDSILLKQGELTAEEYDQMKKHTTYGCEVILRTESILGENSFLNFAREITKFHHEKWNGTGYPCGLRGEEIPLSARIMAVADVYDALVTKRPYKQPMSHENAIQIIIEDAGVHFDPRLVKIFVENHTGFKNIAEKYIEFPPG